MKVIDLLNMIANGEDVPIRIKYCGRIYQLNGAESNYLLEDSEDIIFLTDKIHEYRYWYNSEVEILEDEEKIDIQNIEELPKIISITPNESSVRTEFNNIIDNQNAILNAIKQLDNKLKEK